MKKGKEKKKVERKLRKRRRKWKRENGRGKINKEKTSKEFEKKWETNYIFFNRELSKSKEELNGRFREKR